MINLILRPLLKLNRYQLFSQRFFHQSFLISNNRFLKLEYPNFTKIQNYSDLKVKDHEITTTINESDLINSQTNLPDKNVKKDLLISEEFKYMLEERLNPANFKTLPYKQDEINKIISKLENPFNLYYLFERYSKEFATYNLVNFIKRLAYLAKNNNKLAISESIILPEQIRNLLTKQIIKNASFLEPFECLTVFQKLPLLGFNLNDYSIKAMLQILKFHVNELDIDEIILSKIILNKLKTNNLDGTIQSNEYADSLEKALNLAVQIKYEDLKNPNQAVKLLNNFSDCLSDNNFEKIFAFILYKSNLLDLTQSLDLIKLLAKRKYFHFKMLKKINKNLLNSNEKEILKFKKKFQLENYSDLFSMVLKEFNDSFLNNRYYDAQLFEFIIDKQLTYLKNSIYNQNNFKFCSEIIKSLLETCIKFQHKRIDLLDFLFETKINELKLAFEEMLPIELILSYAGLVNYDKLASQDLEKCIELFLSNEYNDELKIQVVKSLCWMKQKELSKNVLNSLNSPENLPLEDKVFIKDVFQSNHFKFDEKIPGKSKLEQHLEKVVNEMANQKYKLTSNNTNYQNLNYFIDYIITNPDNNKKCFVHIAPVSDYFRNAKEHTANCQFKIDYLKDLLKKDENKNDCYWILPSKNFQNLDEEVLTHSFKNKIKSIFEISNSE